MIVIRVLLVILLLVIVSLAATQQPTIIQRHSSGLVQPQGITEHDVDSTQIHVVLFATPRIPGRYAVSQSLAEQTPHCI